MIQDVNEVRTSLVKSKAPKKSSKKKKHSGRSRSASNGGRGEGTSKRRRRHGFRGSNSNRVRLFKRNSRGKRKTMHQKRGRND
eukprot:UN03829